MRIRRLLLCACIVASLTTYYFFRLAPRTASGEVFLQLRSGRVVFASGAEVTAFPAESERGKKWFNYSLLDEKRENLKRMTFNAAESERARELRQQLLYGSDLATLGGILAMPTNEGGEKTEAVCDARGNFRIKLRPGSYWIVASGRAGQVNGIWSKEIDVPDDRKIEFSEGDVTLDRSITE